MKRQIVFIRREAGLLARGPLESATPSNSSSARVNLDPFLDDDWRQRQHESDLVQTVLARRGLGEAKCSQQLREYGVHMRSHA
jgi:hypothetical protein